MPGNPVGNVRRPPSTEAQIGRTDAVRVQFAVLHEDLPGTTMLDPITGVDLQPFHVVVMDTVAQAIEKRRQRIPVARARYDRVDHNGKRVACLQVSEPRIEPPIRGRLHVAQFAQGAQVNRQRASPTLRWYRQS